MSADVVSLLLSTSGPWLIIFGLHYNYFKKAEKTRIDAFSRMQRSFNEFMSLQPTNALSSRAREKLASATGQIHLWERRLVWTFLAQLILLILLELIAITYLTSQRIEVLLLTMAVSLPIMLILFFGGYFSYRYMTLVG